MNLLPDLKSQRKLTPEEESENKEVKSEYNRKKTLLTGYKDPDKQEKTKKKLNTVSKKKSQPQKITQYV